MVMFIMCCSYLDHYVDHAVVVRHDTDDTPSPEVFAAHTCMGNILGVELNVPTCISEGGQGYLLFFFSETQLWTKS